MEKERQKQLSDIAAKLPYNIQVGGINLIVEQDVFPPDVAFLSTHLARELKNYAPFSALDMGCGTGFLALTLKQMKVPIVWAVDVHQPAINCTKRNVILHSYLNDIHVVKSDLFQELDESLKFDLIVFDHPYYPNADNPIFGYSPDGGREILQRFFATASKFLNKNAVILVSFSTVADNIHAPQPIAEQLGYTVKEIWQGSFCGYKHFIYECKLAV